MKAEEKSVPGLRLLNGGLAEGADEEVGFLRRYQAF